MLQISNKYIDIRQIGWNLLVYVEAYLPPTHNRIVQLLLV